MINQHRIETQVCFTSLEMAPRKQNRTQFTQVNYGWLPFAKPDTATVTGCNFTATFDCV